MKILLITESIEISSGWGRYAHSLAREYRQKNIEFSVIKVDPRAEEGNEFPLLRPPTLWGILRNSLIARRAARDCDIVHALDCWPYALYGWAAVAGTYKKLFITGVGTYSVAPLAHPVKKFLLQRAFRRAKKIFAMGNYTKKRMLEKVSLDNIITVFWGSTKLPMLSGQEIERFYEDFNITRGKFPLIVTVGMVKHRKGQLDTLKALAHLKKQYPEWLYLMVGSTDDKGYLGKIRDFAKQEGIEDNIKLVGNVSDDRALSFFYEICDIFAMNSNNDGEHFEGFGLVFLEAEQFGKPVIGSRNCGIEEALDDGMNGYLTKQGDSHDIAEKIQLILKGDRKKMGEASKEYFSRFSWEKTAYTYLEHYKNS